MYDHKKAVREFQAGDSTRFQEQYMNLLDAQRIDEAVQYIESFVPHIGKSNLPHDPHAPQGAACDWVEAICVALTFARQPDAVPVYWDSKFSGEVPVWVAAAVADTAGSLTQIEWLKAIEAEIWVRWAIECGAEGRELQHASIRLAAGTGSLLDNLRVEKESIPEAAIRRELIYITFNFVEEQILNRTLTHTQLLSLLEHLLRDEDVIDPANIGNLQWYALPLGDSDILSRVARNFSEREMKLREEWDAQDLANVLGNHALIGALLGREDSERYFQEAIDLDNAEAAALYACLPGAINYELQSSIRNAFADNPELSQTVQLGLEDAIEKFETMADMCGTLREIQPLLGLLEEALKLVGGSR